MDSANLDNLMREVLSMVKERENPSAWSRNSASNVYKRYDEVVKNLRERVDSRNQAGEIMDLKNRNALQLQETVNTGNLAVQGSQNTGNLDVANVNNTGAMARLGLSGKQELEKQGLINEGNIAGKNIEAGYHRDVANLGLEGSVRHGENAARIGLGKGTDHSGEVIKGWAGGANPTAESLAALLTAYRAGSGKGGVANKLPAPGTPEAETAFENARSLARKSLGASSIVTPTREDGLRFMTPDTDTAAPPATVTPAPADQAAAPPETLADKLRKRKLWFGESPAPIQPTVRAKTNWRNANAW